jgi:glyoxylase-like metal-dependent hydrolase (beta-lactamase superfamily II)
MLIRTTGPVGDGLFLLTLGESGHYLAHSGSSLSVFDPGLSVHVPALLKRVETLGFAPKQISHIFVTHAHADRMGGVPALRLALEEAGAAPKVVGSHLLARDLRAATALRAVFDADRALCSEFDHVPALSFEAFSAGMKLDRIIADSDIVPLESLTVRGIFTPGHTGTSFAYYINPGGHLIVDEAFGYYRGRLLAAPGGDDDLRAAQASIKKVQDLELTSICLPSAGALTGSLVRRHMHSVVQNTDDLFAECAKAFTEGIAREEIERSVREQFYSGATDPSVRASLDRSFAAVWRQILRAAQPSSPSPAP